jgi:hypothetical protein
LNISVEAQFLSDRGGGGDIFIRSKGPSRVWERAIYTSGFEIKFSKKMAGNILKMSQSKNYRLYSTGVRVLFCCKTDVKSLDEAAGMTTLAEPELS